jgi:hypothetical protein
MGAALVPPPESEHVNANEERTAIAALHRVSGDRCNPPREAEFEVITPMKMKARLCATHFMDYVESRLGTGTVAQLVQVRKAGGK